MKKLFLTSQFHKVANELLPILNKPASETTVAFIPTAADVYDEKPWMYADRDKLVEMGMQVFDLSLKGKTKQEIEEALSKADVIFVSGGNTFYLLNEARKSNFLDVAKQAVESGAVYVGSSAGSYLTCPTIEVANWEHQDLNIVGLTDLNALCLVPFLLSVHYKPEYKDSLLEGMTKTKLPVRILTDDQAIVVLDSDYKLVGKGEEVKLVA